MHCLPGPELNPIDPAQLSLYNFGKQILKHVYYFQTGVAPQSGFAEPGNNFAATANSQAGMPYQQYQQQQQPQQQPQQSQPQQQQQFSGFNQVSQPRMIYLPSKYIYNSIQVSLVFFKNIE